MQVSVDQRRLLALCAIRVADASPDWSVLAREAPREKGIDRLYAADLGDRSEAARETAKLLRAGLRNLDVAKERVEHELELANKAGARLVTVLDDDYPANLRLVWDLPPFLFMLGADLDERDLRAVAVVGTRDATEQGVRTAADMARALVERDVTVVSGLAKGIDAAAHTAALEAGGRTMAVIGTGITKTYPSEHAELSRRIAAAGTLVSQFWPSMHPARWTFPRRNAVMSGISQGTVVIEASATSGAKMQARLASQHGKQVFLIKQLVTSQEWARRYVEKGWATEVDSVDDVVKRLASPKRIRQVTSERQMTLDLA
jgi:DNA processing protein